jgi:hypothetical protein
VLELLYTGVLVSASSYNKVRLAISRAVAALQLNLCLGVREGHLSLSLSLYK